MAHKAKNLRKSDLDWAKFSKISLKAHKYPFFWENVLHHVWLISALFPCFRVFAYSCPPLGGDFQLEYLLLAFSHRHSIL